MLPALIWMYPVMRMSWNRTVGRTCSCNAFPAWIGPPYRALLSPTAQNWWMFRLTYWVKYLVPCAKWLVCLGELGGVAKYKSWTLTVIGLHERAAWALCWYVINCYIARILYNIVFNIIGLTIFGSIDIPPSEPWGLVWKRLRLMMHLKWWNKLRSRLLF
jgi:hypothetical protein